MILEVVFAFYMVLLHLGVVFAGINFYRIRDKTSIHPQLAVFLFPFCINFGLAKTIFYDINPFLTTLLPCIAIYLIGRKLKVIRIFGLTGGIATGKSTLVQMMIKNLPKLVVVDCDKITRQLSDKGNSGYKLIIKMLGDKSQQYLNPLTKQIERQKFSKFVFNNKDFRKDLTAKMGRYIMWKIFKQILGHAFSKNNLIMIDAPILYETKVLQYFCYPIIVVGCTQQQQIRRLQKRNEYSRQQAEQRIRSQMPLYKKQIKSDIYIKNQGSEEDLLKNTLVKLNRFLAIKK